MTALSAALADPRASVRLQAVMAAGIEPSLQDLEILVDQCATETDFQVREMLTWALLRLPTELVVPRVVAELGRPEAQVRRQALHTLSKIRDSSTWPAVAERLDDSDPEVIRTAWYAAVALVPESERAALARKLALRLGEGSRETRLSLSRALVNLGEDAIAPVLTNAMQLADENVREHAAATEQLLRDPDSGSALAVERARREVALGRTRSAKG